MQLYSCLVAWFPSGILRVGFRISRVIGLGLGSCLDCGLSSISAQSRFVSAAGQRSPPGSSESPPCTSRCTSGTFLLVRLYICAFLFLCLYMFVRYLPSEHPIVPSPDIWKIQSVQALKERPFENDYCLGLKEMKHLLPPPASLKKLSTSSPRFVRIISLSGAEESNNLILNYLNILTVRHPDRSLSN